MIGRERDLHAVTDNYLTIYNGWRRCDRSDSQNDERNDHRIRRLMNVMFRVMIDSGFAVERHEQQPEHVERRHSSDGLNRAQFFSQSRTGFPATPDYDCERLVVRCFVIFDFLPQ